MRVFGEVGGAGGEGFLMRGSGADGDVEEGGALGGGGEEAGGEGGKGGRHCGWSVGGGELRLEVEVCVEVPRMPGLGLQTLSIALA